MAIIHLPILVPEIATVFATYNRVRVYRSTTGITGPFAEITTAPTRIVLLDNVMAYEYDDTVGDASYFYRTDLFNSVTLATSLPSDAQQGEGDPALDVISVDALKQNYLFGVPMEDQDGNPFPDDLFKHYIRAAVSYVERRLDIPLRPLSFTDDKPESGDFITQDYNKWLWLQLKHSPLISVGEVKLVLPTNQVVISYDKTWIFPDLDAGVVQIIPGSGQLLLGSAGAYLPYLYGMTDFIPDVFRVSYVAGFLKGTVPEDLVHLVGMLAAIGPLNLAGDLVFGPGVAGESVGLDALMTNLKTSRSPQLSVYGARILQYNAAIKEMFTELRRYFKGIRMVVA